MRKIRMRKWMVIQTRMRKKMCECVKRERRPEGDK